MTQEYPQCGVISAEIMEWKVDFNLGKQLKYRYTKMARAIFYHINLYNLQLTKQYNLQLL